jgi:uncharacterized protein (DUF488 family)
MSDVSPGLARVLWTIGHSNHPLESFLALLAEQRIEVVADVRSSPYSRYASQFNREALCPALRNRAIQYVFLGDLLGGRAEDERFQDDQGHMLYGRMAQSPGFRQGIERLLDGVGKFRVAVFCGEEDPTDCHRRRLVGRVLQEHGVRLLHIRGDGRVQTEQEVAADETFRKTKGQRNLFETEDPDEWKSTQSVLPRKAPPNSSASSGGPESGD